MSKVYYHLMWMYSSEDTLSDKSTKGQGSIPACKSLVYYRFRWGIVGNLVLLVRRVRPQCAPHVTMKILYGLEDHKKLRQYGFQTPAVTDI